MDSKGKLGKPLKAAVLVHADDFPAARRPDSSVGRNVMHKIEARFAVGYLD